MKKPLLLLLFITSLYATTTNYSIIVNKPFDAALFDITQDYDRTISAVGFSKEYKNNSNDAASYTNGYFIGGYTLDGSLLVVKLDAKANLLYSRTFGTKNYDRMNNLILMSDGGVLAVGSSISSGSSSDSMFNSGLGNNDIFITRFSKDVQQLWSKKYGTVYDD